MRKSGLLLSWIGPRGDGVRGASVVEGTRDHFRNSRVEFLKGLRSLIDEKIERLSRHAEPKGTQVPVD